MISMWWAFVIFTTLLLCGGVAFTVVWFWQAGARLETAARARRELPDGVRRR
ncbi:MAG TPA: hypothetical protein VF659_05490 [Pyrinomonadaceae bacterium]|jgi:hypothetical protein